MKFGPHSLRCVKSKLHLAQLIILRQMVKRNKRMKPSSHVLYELSKVAHEGNMLGEPKKILQVDAKHLQNRSFRRFPVKWKDYPDNGASWD
jgi:hypothetical protein